MSTTAVWADETHYFTNRLSAYIIRLMLEAQRAEQSVKQNRPFAWWACY